MRDYGKIKGYRVEGRKVAVEFENGRMEVTALTDEIINVFVPIWSEDNRSKAIEKDDLERVLKEGFKLEGRKKNYRG